jgi:hypothetical protein
MILPPRNLEHRHFVSVVYLWSVKNHHLRLCLAFGLASVRCNERFEILYGRSLHNYVQILFD